MSGIYIPGVSMPKEGGALCIIIHHDGKVCHFFDLQGEQIATAVPVPPHGRLIDADALLESEPDYTIPNYNSDGYLADLEGAYTEVQIENAPTIIPAGPTERC